MKNLIITVFLTVTSIAAFAQASVSEGNYKFNLPAGVQKLNEQQFLDLQKQLFNESFVYGSTDHLYKLNNILLSFRKEATKPIFKKSLEKQQSILISIYNKFNKKLIIDEAKIVNINNVKIGIIRHHQDDNCFFRFSTDYDSNNNFVIGFIQYKQADAGMVQEYAAKLLQSITVKN